MVGLVILFTASLHEQLAFDAIVIFWALLLIGIVTGIEYWVLRGTAESWWIAARAVIALAASGSLTAVEDSAGIALVLAIWAALTGVVTAMRLARKVQPKRVAIPSMLLSFALAIAVILVRDDPVAIIGFFGAYTLIRGVFLGIAAFDTRAQNEDESVAIADAEPENTDESDD